VTTPGDDELSTWWDLVTEGYSAVRERIADELTTRFDLTPTSFEVLLRLARSPDRRLPMTLLAREAALSSGGFTKLADRLCSAGLIRRAPSDEDRRVIYACLTEHGADVAHRARQVRAELLRRLVLTPLGPDAARALAETMRTLRDAQAARTNPAATSTRRVNPSPK
jgi:DNA-binding MarR family transcriptional regulator